MGHWSVSCGISNIAITSGQPVVLLPLKKGSGEGYTSHLPATLPIFGNYDDYGGIEEIIEDVNTKLIESHFGVSVEDFCKFLVDGKFTYGRSETKEIETRIQNLGEISEWRFMWIHRKVWDFMTTHIAPSARGHFEFGNPAILELIGFVRDGDTTDERYTQRWLFGDKVFASDGTWINVIGAKRGETSVFNFNRGYSKLSDHITIPEDKLWLGEKAMWQLWEYLSERDSREKLGWIIAGRRYGYGAMSEPWDDEFIESLLNSKRKSGATDEEIEEYRKVIDSLNADRVNRGKTIADAYLRDIKTYGAGLCDLVTLRHNMHCMSGDFTPHQLYLTPQDGEHGEHQYLLDAFARINKEIMIDRGWSADEDEE
jgi:hypothetical protein